MSRDPEEVSKLTESTYKNVMEQLNPGLRNLVTLGKSYEKAMAAMNLAGKMYFEAISKIGENAAVSPVSRELGVVLMEISEVHKKIHLELEENFKIFHKEIITELEKKTDMDVKYMNATFKRYQSEHKMKQDSLERSQTELKKLRRKSQGKNNSKYQTKENEYLETLSSRQMDMQKFIADGCKEALVEEKRRFCFLVDKHCVFTYQISTFHEKAKEMLTLKLPSWQDKCGDVTDVPETIETMIRGLQTPVNSTPQPSPTPPAHTANHIRTNSDSVVTPPPAPALKAHTSPLASMFAQDTPPSPTVRTIFPHTAENNDTLLTFDEGDIVTLLIPDERDGWLYGELDRTKEPVTQAHSASMLNLADPVPGHEEDEEEDEVPVVLPPADYADSPTSSVASLPFTAPQSPNSQRVSLTTSHAPSLLSPFPFQTLVFHWCLSSIICKLSALWAGFKIAKVDRIGQ
ncbi:hypothetical protein JZ751_006323 [Albula glossodonta]|uniref:IMD domain-containing protein n=1 Tax=Albula glossodonta TaxID=121402 RepID=A0A8T2N4T3_9TELE|nr:hypothetical protein JZ751_006323 [Albula glossodonta]